MLKNQLTELLSNMVDGNEMELFKEEKDFIEKYQLLSDDIKLVEKDPSTRFLDAYIERSDKESEEVIAEEGPIFLNQPIDYLKKHMNEFIYLESTWMELIGVDSISLEVDDVFRTFDVMLGLKLKKKFETNIKDYLKLKLIGEDASFDLIFNQEDGLWNLNFDLDSLAGFSEDMTIGEAYQLIYRFLFNLVEEVEEPRN